MFECFHDGTGMVLARPDYLDDFRRTQKSDIHRYDKLERGQTFKEQGSPSWDAFVAGDWAGALRLIEADRDSSAKYFQDMARRGLVFRRLRIVEFPVTPYVQWEMQLFRLRSELGEEIRVLNVLEIADLENERPLPEIVILGDSVMYNVIYDEELKGAGARRFTDPEQIATTAAEFESLYSKGENFSDFFEREIAPLGPPTVH
ncbi:DUF6879 family protein [Streptomyces sp. NPDC026672]|uniref:DUF6879 family protein n=1 Tax=unclassified Streptomyces TaxID=2593676 RepID=UPI003405D987